MMTGLKSKLRILNNSVDAYAQSRIQNAKEQDGLEPSCKRGCNHCCKMLVTASLPEVVASTNQIALRWDPTVTSMSQVVAQMRFLGIRDRTTRHRARL